MRMPGEGITPERKAELEREVARIFGAFFSRRRDLERAPVDVEGTADDEVLDDHLWLRLGVRTGDDPEAVASLSDDLRAYYATRLFEWECESGGVSGFVDTAAWIAPHVAEGYRYLELPEAAAAFEELWSSPIVHGLIADDSYVPTDEEVVELNSLARAVGTHDTDRIALARRHPERFSI
jgi:hypothetical protein